MYLRLYRRHENGCKHRSKGVSHLKCNCPLWCDGTDEHGKRVRVSLKTNNWELAQQRVSEMERSDKPSRPATNSSASLSAASKAFITDCKLRNLRASTINTYQNVMNFLNSMFPEKAVGAIDLDGLARFRASRSLSPSTASVETIVLRMFFQFCIDRGWCASNPASKLKLPKLSQPPTMPFTREEVAAIIAACDRFQPGNYAAAVRNRARAKALVLVMLYSGLRISDAISLRRSAIDVATGRLMLRMMKTQHPLYVRLPQAVIDALATIPNDGPYFFWNGKSELSSASRVGWKTIGRVMKAAGVVGGHPHRFRDTFSVELLNNGADIRTVQLLLGHTSIKTTEKHYAPFVTSMQRALDTAVATLHFASTADGKPIVNTKDDALGDAKGNVLPFPGAQTA